MLKSNLIKLSLILKSQEFYNQPFKIIYRVLIIFFSSLMNISFKYKINFGNSLFVYTFKNYPKSGLGGRGQYILREGYDPFFKIGQKIFNDKFNFIDIGCSRGFFSMYLISLDKNVKGISIEPLDEAIRDFKEILRLNRVNSKKIQLIKGVISNKDTQQDLYRVNDEHGYYSLARDVYFADKKIKKKLKVKSFTIDNLIINQKKLNIVDFIKIDSEGAEYEILMKSKKTIRKFKPIFLCEMTRKKKEILKFLKDFKYELYAIVDGKVINYTPRETSSDLFAIRKDSRFYKSFRNYL